MNAAVQTPDTQAPTVQQHLTAMFTTGGHKPDPSIVAANARVMDGITKRNRKINARAWR